MDKRKLYHFSKKYVNSNNIRILLLIIPLLIFCIIGLNNGSLELLDLFDIKIVSSVLIVLICDAIAKIICFEIAKNTEDAVKLSEDYKGLCKMYVCDNDNMIVTPTNNIKLPVMLLSSRKIDSKPYNFVFKEKISNKRIEHYNLPKQVADNSEDLLSAHSFSTIYNNINIRLTDISIKNNRVSLEYGFTTYFDSLITNRAMDYPLSSGKTIRQIYEPGPFINSLKESKLSNHLGFNGFIEFKDNKIVFIKRSSNMSIAKNIYAQSIGASLKTKYCLNMDHKLTRIGLSNAIKQEVKDELHIDLDGDKDYSKSVFAIYRDLVEGGKPQLLFYIHLDNIDSKEFEDMFNTSNNDTTLVDGKELVFFTIDELRNATYSDHSITVNNKEYRMVPSSLGSVILLLNNIK